VRQVLPRPDLRDNRSVRTSPSGRHVAPGAGRRALRLGAGAAVLLLLLGIAGLIATREGPATPAERPSVALHPEPRVSRRVQPGAGDEPYATWRIPGDHALLTIPTVASDGTAWAGQLHDNTLTRIHAPTGTLTTVTLPVDGPARIISAVADSPLRVWLTLEGRHALALFDLERRTYREYPTPTRGSSPFGLAQDAQRRLWFTELTGHAVGLLDPRTESFTEYDLPGEEVHPYLLAIGADGRIWFTVVSHPAVGVLDPTSGDVRVMAVPGLAEQDGTTGIAVGQDGDIWFGTRRGLLGRVQPDTGAITIRATPAAAVYGVAAAPGGLVWLATLGDSIHAFDPVQQAFCSVPTGTDTRWLAVGADGALWVSQGVDETNALGRLSPEQAAQPCGRGTGPGRPAGSAGDDQPGADGSRGRGSSGRGVA
jgi:virginiamycin B lyase